jgi:hypothetical protein
MKKMAVWGAEVPKMVMMEPGSEMNCFIWLAKVPAMKEPRKRVMTCRRPPQKKEE